MNFLMNTAFTQEIAAQRRQALTAAADRHRLRRWFTSTVRRNPGPGPSGGRVIPFSASATPTPATSTPRVGGAAVAPATASPAAAVSDLEHASARVA